jgi:hypothetical protein
MTPAFAVTMNGRTSFELKPQSAEQEIVELAGRLDGVDRFSMILWRLPDGVPFVEVDVNDYPHEYMQCAGDFNDRMTCEIREAADDELHQYVLGRSADETDDAEADQIVPWNDHVAKVRPNEVLSGDEVAELFVHYYRTGTEAPGYSRRELDL